MRVTNLTPECTLEALSNGTLGFASEGTPEHSTVKEMARELLERRKKCNEMLVLIVECRDALTAITLDKARLHNVKLDLADRIEAVLKPWEVPEGTPGSF